VRDDQVADGGPPMSELDADDQAAAFDRELALDSVPLHVVVSPDVDLDAEDPAALEDSPRRRCIATKNAGGRCTVAAMHSHVLCAAHSGVLDPSEGAHARARARREARVTAEERGRLARLGSRGVVQEALAEKAAELRQTIHVLADAAAAGDVQAAKLLVPWMNQAFGMPTERVELQQPQGLDDLDALSTSQLERMVAERRAQLRSLPGGLPQDGSQATG
jgi:hypothetical protein